MTTLKTRIIEYGDCNIVGKNIERLRKEKSIKQKDFISKMQTMGCDINPTSYSKLEGQIRIATDKEIYVISRYELAKRTGIQYQIIDNYYKNKVKRYDSYVIDRMCEALDCSVSDIIEYKK